jgi:hypothetical protein
VMRAGVLLDPREFSCDFLLWGYMKDLVYSIPIDTIEVLREQAGNAAQQFAITEESWNFIGAFIIVLTITAVPLNTSCSY